MSEEDLTFVMPRCKLDALRIRQRKGLRHRQRKQNIHGNLHDDACLKSTPDITDGPLKSVGDYESDIIMLAENLYDMFLGPEAAEAAEFAEVAEAAEAAETNTISPTSQSSIATPAEDAVKGYIETAWAAQVGQDTEYAQHYVHGTFLGPQCRHSNISSNNSSHICREIEGRAQSISTSYKTLHQILLRHESAIQARWTKKRPHQKQKFLLELWPNMPKMHRPDFYAHRLGGPPDKSAEFRDWYIWPYINQHDLTIRESLLLLLNSRGFCAPSNFADADVAAMKHGLENGLLKSTSLSGYSIILSDAESLEDYGKLVDISACSQAELLDLDKNQISPYYGILILEAQDRLLTFLVNCCKQMLHDIPEESLVSDMFPVLPEAPKIASDVGRSSPAAMAAQAPYRVPAKPNFRQIGLMLGAKALETKDHVLNLRGDPVYFVNAMMKIREHSLGMPLALHESGTPCLDAEVQLTLSRDLAFVVGRAYTDLECFTDLYDQVRQLELLFSQYDTEILPTRDMPDDVLVALLKFQTCVWEVARIRRLALVRVVLHAPAWRKYFGCHRNFSSFNTEKGHVKATAVRRHLIWLFQCITLYDPRYPSLSNATHVFLPLFMDEIETLRENEPEAWELTSSLIGEIIDELSILAQCMEQVDLYLRRIRDYKPSIMEKQYQSAVEWAVKMRHIFLLTKPGEIIYYRFAQLANYTNKRFFYPWDKRRTRENVEAMMKAEWNLDRLWAAADAVVLGKIKGFSKSYVGELIQLLQYAIRRTPNSIEEPCPPEGKRARQRHASHGEDEIYKPPCTLDHDGGEDVGRFKRDGRLQIRSKIKTKGQPCKAVTEPSVSAIEQVVARPPSPIPVDARTLKVFRVLFHNPDVNSVVGEIPWRDFIHAMVCSGFSAQKLQGSMWQFSRLVGDGQQTILFHEPHPHKKLPFYVARAIGWRLNRHFQWSLETFELKKKKQVETLQ